MFRTGSHWLDKTKSWKPARSIEFGHEPPAIFVTLKKPGHVPIAESGRWSKEYRHKSPNLILLKHTICGLNGYDLQTRVTLIASIITQQI